MKRCRLVYLFMKYGVIVTYLIILFSAPSWSQDSQQLEIEVIGESNIPFQMVDTNYQLVGPVVDFSTDLLNMSGYQSRPIYVPWARIMESEVSVPNRLILSITRTQAREDDFHWIGQISDMQSITWKRKSRRKQHHKIVTVGVERGSHKIRALQQHFGVSNVVKFTSADQAFQAFTMGRVDRYVGTPFAVMSKLHVFNLPMDFVERDRINTLKVQESGLYLALTKNSDKALISALSSSFNTKEKRGDVVSLQHAISCSNSSLDDVDCNSDERKMFIMEFQNP